MKKTFSLLIIFFSIFLLTGCLEKTVIDERPLIEQVKSDLELDSELGAISLPLNVDGIIISWVSSKPSVLTEEGEIIIPVIDTSVSLTATLVSGTTIMTKVFNVIIIGKYELVDYTKVQTELENFNFDDYSLTENIILINSINGVNITWESSNSNYLNTSGVINRPAENAGNEEVTLTAYFSYKEIVLEREFIFTIYDMSY